MFKEFVKNVYERIRKVFFGKKATVSKNILFTLGFISAFVIGMYCLIQAIDGNFRSAIYMIVGLLLIYFIHTLLMVCIFTDGAEEVEIDPAEVITQIIENSSKYKLSASQIKTLQLVRKKVK